MSRDALEYDGAMPIRSPWLLVAWLAASCSSGEAARDVEEPAPVRQPRSAAPPQRGSSPEPTPQASWVVLRCDPAAARPPSSFEDLEPDPAKLWTLDVRFDPRADDWAPVRPLPMLWHYASRIEWIDDPPHDELHGARERVLRIGFVVLDRRLARSSHRGVQIDATYSLDVMDVCEP